MKLDLNHIRENLKYILKRALVVTGILAAVYFLVNYLEKLQGENRNV